MIRQLLITGITIGILAWALPTVGFASLTALLLTTIVLTILYSLVRPVLKILFLPVNVITLGLFSGVISVFLLWLATFLVPGFHIRSMILFGVTLSQFMSLVVVSFFIGFVHSFLNKLL